MPTARLFFKNVSKRLDALQIENSKEDVETIYAMFCAADKLKIGKEHPQNRCSHCGQYGKYHAECNYCGAPIE